MKFKLLGTAAAEGWPALFCACESCLKARQLGGKNIRTRSSLLIDEDVKIDIPPDTYHHLLTYGLDLRKLRYMLITHRHEDHLLPSELTYAEPPFVAGPPAPPMLVMGPEPAMQLIREHVNPSRSPLTIRTLDPFIPVRMEEYTFTPIIASHMQLGECYNYIIGKAGKSLLYASDTGWYCEETWDFLKGKPIDCALIECTSGGKESDYSGHLSITGLLKMRDKMIDLGVLQPETPVVATHFSHNGVLLHHELEARLNPYGVEVGYDGREGEA